MTRANSRLVLSSALALLGLGVLSSAAQAQLLVSDSYLTGASPALGQYVTSPAASAQLKAQPGTLVNLGFVNGAYGSGTGTAQFAATTSGLTYAPLGASSATSGKVTYSAAALDSAVRSNARNLSPTPTLSSTYWTSILVNRGTIASGVGFNYVMAGFGGSIAPTTLGAVGGPGLFMGFSGSAGDLAMRYRNTAGNVAETILTSSSANTTYAIVAKISVNTAGITDNVNWWVNPTDFTSETTLTSTALANGAFSGNLLSANTDLVRLNYIAVNWNSSAFFDEVRLGTTLASLGGTSAGAAAPEPGTLALGALGLLALVAQRRRS